MGSYLLARCNGALSFETHHLVLSLKFTIGITIMLFEAKSKQVDYQSEASWG